ncbi:hypothetical protein [Desulfitispora alkaliphila]|uniref:hypothetical protein n=1 Tax=Desulfitispora alkaliphila TaxID=622674 RepID=UPI003D1B36BC
MLKDCINVYPDLRLFEIKLVVSESWACNNLSLLFIMALIYRLVRIIKVKEMVITNKIDEVIKSTNIATTRLIIK